MRYRFLFALSLLPTLVAAQTADQEIVSAVDAPDPVAPGATLTYTVSLTNHGPDPAVNGGVNIFLPLELSHTSSIPPAGWNCTWSGNNGTCNSSSLTPGPYVLIVVTTVGGGVPDQVISASFSTAGITPDPVGGNNFRMVTTTVDSTPLELHADGFESGDLSGWDESQGARQHGDSIDASKAPIEGAHGRRHDAFLERPFEIFVAEESGKLYPGGLVSGGPRRHLRTPACRLPKAQVAPSTSAPVPVLPCASPAATSDRLYPALGRPWFVSSNEFSGFDDALYCQG